MTARFAFLWSCLTNPGAIEHNTPHRQGKLLAWIILFLLLFCTVILLIMLAFDPHHDPVRNQYIELICGVLVFLIVAYILNCARYYQASIVLLVSSAVLVPWMPLLFDPSILLGDIVPLTYVNFSVLLSSIFFPPSITFALAVLQFTGTILVFLVSPVDASLNWFSFLAFMFLVSTFALLANHIIQQDMKQIVAQARQLALNEALLKEQVIHDDLTGLYNRRYMEEMFDREIQRTIRNHSHLCVVVLDVDDFKHINDTLGHLTGDAVLRELGALLGSGFRKSDIACRYGGDEFVLVLPDTSQTATKERIEQLRKDIQHSGLQATVTISAGIASYPEHGTDSKTLLQSADSALYQAKHEGGNCVVVAG